MNYTQNHLLRSTVGLVAGHEFRTPLTGIMGMAEILNGQCGSLTQQEQQLFSNGILESARRLQSLSDRVRIWFHLFDKTAKENEQTLITEKLVKFIAIQKEETYSKKNIRLLFLNDLEEKKVSGSKKLIELALHELLDNAFKFAEEKSIVTFHVYERCNYCVFHIKNTSNSSTIEDLKSYEVFKQFNRSYLEQQGLGIGIEIVRMICIQNDGHLYMNPGKNNKEIEIELLFRLD